MEQPVYTVNTTGINQDTSDSGKSYSFALNATVENFSEEQSMPFLSNTPSNLLCYKVNPDEMVIGQISIHEWDKTILAVYNTITGKQYFVEIYYIYNSKGESDTIKEECCDLSIIERLPQEKIKQTPICTSRIILETDCFKWSKDYKLKFVYKITDCTLNLYFNNCYDEDRFIYFDYDTEYNLKVNSDFLENSGTVCLPIYKSSVDCGKTKWYPDITYPCIDTSIVSGEKEKGVYSYLVAYSTSGGTPLTNFKSLTFPYSITNKGQGIKVKFSEISKNTRYKYFLLVAVETVNNITTYHKKAVLSVEQTEWVDDSMGGSGISAQELFTQYPFYENSCDITISNDIMFKSGLTEFEKFNLQPIVNLIELEWVSTVLKEGDYKKPEIAQNFKSLLRDEVYTFAFQPVSDNGEELPLFPIPGRKILPSDRVIVTNPDSSIDDCDTNPVKRWEIYSTANRKFRSITSLESLYKNCNPGELYEYGDFGYYESTEKYPFVPEVWDSTKVGGENLCGQPIRHFKTPDHCISVHQSNATYNGIVYVFPIGIRLKSSTNISALLDLAVTNGYISQKQRERITGYKILRGNRAGNKSVIAKGIIYDVWKYKRTAEISDTFSNTCSTNINEYFYPNYPYNDLNDDKLIGSNNKHYEGKNLAVTPQKFITDQVDIDNKTRYTFHSPETHFTQPNLGDYVKVEAEVFGQAKGYFNISEEHAEYKILGEKHYNLAKIFGQWMASTITSPTEEALSGAAANLGKSVGTTVGSFFPGFDKLGGALGGLVGGLIGTNIAKNTLSSIVFKNSIILAQTEKILNLFKLMGNYRQHHYQHQSIGKYNNISCYSTEGNKIRKLDTKEYIQEGKLTIQEANKAINFNNAYRESSVYLKTNLPLPSTTVNDRSRVLISEGSGPSTETVSYPSVNGVAKTFSIKATNGRFRIIGVLCTPYLNPEGLVVDEETLFLDHPDSDSQGDFNSEGLRPDFDLDENVPCRYISIYPRNTNTTFGGDSVVLGDLEITQTSECPTLCTDTVDATVTYPCKCNEPTTRDISSFYVSLKNKVNNQYGGIYDIEWLDVTPCVIPIPKTGELKTVKAKKINCGFNSVNFITTCSLNSAQFITNCS
jgi:hypothetical protein